MTSLILNILCRIWHCQVFMDILTLPLLSEARVSCTKNDSKQQRTPIINRNFIFRVEWTSSLPRSWCILGLFLAGPKFWTGEGREGTKCDRNQGDFNRPYLANHSTENRHTGTANVSHWVVQEVLNTYFRRHKQSFSHTFIFRCSHTHVTNFTLVVMFTVWELCWLSGFLVAYVIWPSD